MKATFLGDRIQILEDVTSLPEDIQVDIFIKLPVKSIFMSRCVCKLWRNLLSTPRFSKCHHNYNNIQNKNIHRKLISVTRRTCYIYSTEYDSVTSSPLPSFGKTLEVDMVEILGSCDGLVCFGINGHVIGIVNSRFYRICIWNPLTREYKPVLVKSHFERVKPIHGFGYDRNLDTYKLVRIGRFRETSGFDIQVYTLGSDSWRQSKVPYFFPDEWEENTKHGLLFNGALHWLGYKTAKDGVIVSFDISTERFGDVPLPAAEHTLKINPNSRRYCQKSVAVLGDNLCLFNVECNFGSVAEIWVMQKYGVQESWAKQFSITRPDGGPYFQKYWRLVCDSENGELLISSGFTYDPKKKIFKELNYRTKQMLISTAQCYVESLVSPKSATYPGKPSRPRSATNLTV